MMRTARLCMTVGLLCLLAAPAFPLAQEYRPGTKIVPQENWPAGLADVLTSRTWTAAVWVNGFNYFYYTGDAAALYAFMTRLSKIKADLVLSVQSGQGYGTSLDGKQVETDWEIQFSEWTKADLAPDGTLIKRRPDKDSGELAERSKRIVTLKVWPGGHVDLSLVHVPSNIRVLNPQNVQIGPKSESGRTEEQPKKPSSTQKSPAPGK